jgi:uncharacterized RDD family membrane protein YckC
MIMGMSFDVRVTGRRIVATFVDGVVFSGLNAGLAHFFGTRRADSGFDLTRLSVRGSLWLTLIVFLYYVLLEGLVGRTVGKFVTGIKVIDAETGGRPGLLSGFVRTLLRLIDGFLGYLLALIVVVNSDRRRRLGDMAAKTLVVRA